MTTKNITGIESNTKVATQEIESLYKRVLLFLKDDDFSKAKEYCERILDLDPEYAPAYVGKLCAELMIKNEACLINQEASLEKMPDYMKALRFADADYRAKLEKYNEEPKRKEEERIKLVRKELERKWEQEERMRIERERIAKFKGYIAAGYEHTVGLKSDGTVVAAGDRTYGQCNVKTWRNNVAVFAGDHFTFGLLSTGKLLSNKISFYSSKYYSHVELDVSNWKHVTAVHVGSNFVICKTKGEILMGGIECEEIWSLAKNWVNEIIDIAAGSEHIVGLKHDGTVITTDDKQNVVVSGWRNIVAIASGGYSTVGLKADGTVVTTGTGEYSTDIGNWSDIIAIDACSGNTFGLKSDGTVVASGRYLVDTSSKNSDNWKHANCNVGGWRDIVAIAAGGNHVVGLKADGTVVADGSNENGQCNIRNWDIGPETEEKRLIKEKLAQWKAQGLCMKCGGKLSGLIFKECKSCQ